jgi:hypothetical protein
MMAWDRNAEAGVLSVGSDDAPPLDRADESSKFAERPSP